MNYSSIMFRGQWFIIPALLISLCLFQFALIRLLPRKQSRFYSELIVELFGGRERESAH